MTVQYDYRRVMDVFDEVCDLPATQQASAIHRLCAGDESLCLAIQRMLEHDRQDSDLVIEIDAGGGLRMLAEEIASDEKPQENAATSDGEPAQLGPYRIIRKIGEGGMGVVYLAQQRKPQRTVALKVIRSAMASPTALRRFEHEAHVLGLLAHPGIAQIFEAGTAEPIMADGSRGGPPQPFLAMEFIDGSPITAYAADHRLSTRQRLELMMQVCRAVEYAHQRGVIHRDLKPSNILVVNEGIEASKHQGIKSSDELRVTSDESRIRKVHSSFGTPKILDFGVARLTDSDLQVTTIQTDIGQLIGTLQYMSPEQVAADPAGLDTRSDVYALGVIMHELLTGKPPYDLRNLPVHEAARIIRDEEPSKLSTLNRTLRGDVETIALKALEKDKTRRYQSAAELAEDIRRHLGHEPIIARPPSTLYQLRKFAQRNKLAVGAAAAVMLALILGVAGTTRGMFEARRQRDEAVLNERIARAVNEFLNNDLLGQADPSNQPDRDLTLRAVLDRAAASISGRFESAPLVRASIHSTLGRTYQSLGEFQKAQPHLQSSLQIHAAELGERHEKTLTARLSVADVLRLRGDYDQSETICRALITAATAQLGATADLTLDARDSLALVLEKLNRYQEAEPLAIETFSLREQRDGPTAKKTLGSMRLLGMMYERNGKFELAEDMMARSVQATISANGEDHPETLSAMNNLALVYFGQQRYAEAEQLLDRSYSISKRVLGERHQDTLVAMSNLAMMLTGQQRYDEAEPLMVEKLRIVEEVLGPTHSDTLNARNSLAGLYYRTKRHDLEEPLLRQTLELSRAAYGEKHLETMVAIASLARMQLAMKRYDEARENGEYAYALLSETLGDEHPITQMMITYLVRIAQGREQPDEADRWEQKLKK